MRRDRTVEVGGQVKDNDTLTESCEGAVSFMVISI